MIQSNLTINRAHGSIALLGLTLLSACTVTPPRGGPVIAEIQRSMAESRQQSQDIKPTEQLELPGTLVDVLTPLATSEKGAAPRAKPIERRFDLTVKSTPARAFFLGLVKDTPYSIVLPPKLP